MKPIHESGKRKKAIARATVKTGKGQLRVNNLAIEQYQPEIAKSRIQEPMILAKEYVGKLDVDVNVNGGGIMGQADAARLAIGRALVKYNAKLKQVFLDYDRQLLVADVRRKEVSKPNSQGQARAKRQKSYR